MKRIPTPLREQLSRAGKARAKAFTPKYQSEAGKRSWEARLAKAKALEAEKKQHERQAAGSISGPARIVQNPNIPVKGIF